MSSHDNYLNGEATLVVGGKQFTCDHVAVSMKHGHMHLEATAVVPNARDELIGFAKTGGPVVPPALAMEGNVSDHGWVDNAPTYSAVLAARDEKHPTRAVPRMFEQKPWHGSPDKTRLKAGCFDCGSSICELCGPQDPTQYETLGDTLSRALERRKRPQRPESLNDWTSEVHASNAHWWHDPATGVMLDRNMGEMLMLVVSEIAEAMEGERKDLMDDHLPHRKMAEVELADAVIRIADIVGARGIDLDTAIGDILCKPLPDNKGEALFWIIQSLQAIRYYEGWVFARKLARCFKRIEMYADKHGYDLWGAVYEKREYNKTRADHKTEARLAPNGKKF